MCTDFYGFFSIHLTMSSTGRSRNRTHKMVVKCTKLTDDTHRIHNTSMNLFRLCFMANYSLVSATNLEYTYIVVWMYNRFVCVTLLNARQLCVWWFIHLDVVVMSSFTLLLALLSMIFCRYFGSGNASRLDRFAATWIHWRILFAFLFSHHSVKIWHFNEFPSLASRTVCRSDLICSHSKCDCFNKFTY